MSPARSASAAVLAAALFQAGCALEPVGGSWQQEVAREPATASSALAPIPLPPPVPPRADVVRPVPKVAVEIPKYSEPLAEGAARPVFKIGQPYEVMGQVYVPKDDPGYDVTGFASWYGGKHQGTKTANGERYDAGALTAAHTTLPMPSYVLVTNLANNHTVMLRVNNRGPFVKSRIIDVSKRAADLLGFSGRGVARVRVKYAGRAPLDGATAKEQAFLAQQPWYKPDGPAPNAPGN